MSGIELAGLALGALPILISAIESYNDGLDPLKSFVNWKSELPQYIRKLRNEHVHYAQTMRQLLEPITTEFELAEMLADPSGKLWKDKGMAEKLQDRLQESYQAYQSTILDVERIAKKLAGKLDLDRAAELKRNDLEAIIVANPQKNNDKFEFRKRVRFGMSKKTIKLLLEELHECNKELERFTDKSEKLDTVRKSIKPSFATRLQRIQDLAKGLHTSIVSSWSCSCRSYHKTSLQLEQREDLYASGYKKPKPSTQLSFTVSFSTFGDEVYPWAWQEAEIHIEDEDACHSAPSTPIPKPNMRKSVSFGDKPPPPYSATDTSPTPPMIPTLQEVKDLCASIQHLHKSTPWIGFSLNSKSKLLRGVYPVDSPLSTCIKSRHIVTLEDLLSQPPIINGRPAKLSKKERYQLAVTLASSALQLNSTPWFPDQWSAKDILFHKTSDGPRPIDIDHPYIAPKLIEQSKDPTLVNGNGTNGSNGVSKPRTFQNKNTILLALAIALLELYFGISADQCSAFPNSHTSPFTSTNSNQATNTNPWQLCAIAYEWAESEQENLSAAFSNAVNHCLRCFSDPSSSLKDAEFLQAAVECIVLPLRDELGQFLGKSAA